MTKIDSPSFDLPSTIIETKINELYLKFKNLHESPDFNGHLASYIPELAKVSPELFGIAVTTCDGRFFSCGDAQVDFTLQSTSKPFMYGLALKEHSAQYVHTKVGVEPSGEAFNSIIELEKKTHLPFNPMINSGAIAVANLIKNNSQNHRIDIMLEHFSALANRHLKINHQVFESEKKTAHRNRAIAHLLRHFDVIDDEIEESLDLYFKQCSVMVNVKDLSVMGSVLANKGVNPLNQQIIFSSEHSQQILSLMMTCGMYDTAGTWAYRVGVPAKSGVSGAIVAVIPRKMAIAVYSPLIDHHGHSVKGLNVIELFCQQLGLSLYA